jgi:hypothetical protein
VESSFVLSKKLIAEGPTRLKEEYVEGSLSTPNISDVPSQLKGFYDQLVATLKRLPAAMKDVVTPDFMDQNIFCKSMNTIPT